MPDEQQPEPQRSFKGVLGLLVALGVIAILLILVPGYRWFFLVSAAVGVGIAAFLRYWYERRPVKVENKRPLGLD